MLNTRHFNCSLAQLSENKNVGKFHLHWKWSQIILADVELALVIYFIFTISNYYDGDSANMILLCTKLKNDISM